MSILGCYSSISAVNYIPSRYIQQVLTYQNFSLKKKQNEPVTIAPATSVLHQVMMVAFGSPYTIVNV